MKKVDDKLGINDLYKELEKGLESIRKGETFSEEEVWDEINKIFQEKK